MLTTLIAFSIDAVGAYLLAQKFNRWIALIPLAVILAIVSSITSNTVAFFVAQGIDPSISSAVYIVKAFFGIIKNTFWCIFCIWLFRRKKLKAAEKKIDQVN
jgi:hypothetical protein